MPATSKGFTAKTMVTTSPETEADILAACKLFEVAGCRARPLSKVEFYRAAAALLLEQLREGSYRPPEERPGEKLVVSVRKPAGKSWTPGKVVWRS